MPLIETTGDLFANLPEKVIITHACNSFGKWGRGIAVQFKNKYPMAYKSHQVSCKTCKIGDAQILHDPNGVVGCLITSWQFSPPDNPMIIMDNTKLAVRDMLLKAHKFYPGFEIHSNMFNSGLFKVPWSITRSVLIEELEAFEHDIVWKVWQWTP